ncbi:MAG: hypothetical protein JWM10_164 [Myxococcaceae bacterium]|nr:hypothetical protein [Myxococcaceae bacterium]
MQAAATAERERVHRELQRLVEREREIADELVAVRSARAQLEDELTMLNRFAHADEGTMAPRPQLRAVPQPPSDVPPTGDGAHILRGARIRETAVRLLASTAHADEAVHYRTWFELLTSQGYTPAGKDPLATFLTQLSRSPVVRRTTSAGMYELDLNFPETAQRRVDHLREELTQAQNLPSDASIQDIDAARERRAALTADIEATERAIEEARRSLGANSTA